MLDNLKEGVLKPDVYEPTLNPLYRDVLKHYGVVALPCRVRHPRPQGEGRSGHRPHPAHAAARDALRELGGGADLPRPLGGTLGRHPHPRHHQAPGGGDVCRGEAAPTRHSPPSPSATTASESARCTSTAASRSKGPTTRRRPATSAGMCRSSGTTSTSASSSRAPAPCCASTCAQPRGRLPDRARGPARAVRRRRR